ncbi:MAG TPA: hypothetical protein VH184_00645, partial [Dongiaceae bacterium]|nr:hypothetical protein [Dongiaceae bacterium]
MRSANADCESIIAEMEATADRVTAIASSMRWPAAKAGDFLSGDHMRSAPEHYARDAIYIAPGGDLSRLIGLPITRAGNRLPRQGCPMTRCAIPHDILRRDGALRFTSPTPGDPVVAAPTFSE